MRYISLAITKLLVNLEDSCFTQVTHLLITTRYSNIVPMKY